MQNDRILNSSANAISPIRDSLNSDFFEFNCYETFEITSSIRDTICLLDSKEKKENFFVMNWNIKGGTSKNMAELRRRLLKIVVQNSMVKIICIQEVPKSINTFMTEFHMLFNNYFIHYDILCRPQLPRGNKNEEAAILFDSEKFIATFIDFRTLPLNNFRINDVRDDRNGCIITLYERIVVGKFECRNNSDIRFLVISCHLPYVGLTFNNKVQFASHFFSFVIELENYFNIPSFIAGDFNFDLLNSDVQLENAKVFYVSNAYGSSGRIDYFCQTKNNIGKLFLSKVECPPIFPIINLDSDLLDRSYFQFDDLNYLFNPIRSQSIESHNFRNAYDHDPTIALISFYD